MVRPIVSKRKLFNSNKDQFKENEPGQVNGRKGESYHYQPSLNQTSNSQGFISHKKASCVLQNSEKKSDEDSKIYDHDGLKKFNCENGSNHFPHGRIVMPMSERQQIALVMQLSSPTNKSEQISTNSPHTPTTPLFGRGLAKRNERGETLLHIAAIKGDAEKVSLLISQGAKVNATDYAGWTALHEACNRGFLIIAALLIGGGADVNAKGLDNDTPLHDACINNHYQIVRLLLVFGAKADAVNCRGKSPIDVCRSSSILSLLEESQLGKLENLSIFTSKSHSSTVPEIEKILLEKGFLNNNNCSSRLLENCENMSRKTPPNMKPEEKAADCAPSTTASSVDSVSCTIANVSSGNNRPVSPRVSSRLLQGSKTPDKCQPRSNEAKSSMESEDIYEFRCSKDDSKDIDEKDERSKSPPDAPSTSKDAKSDKRPRDNETEDEEEFKKKRRKDDANKDNSKLSQKGNISSRTSSTEKVEKSNQRVYSTNGNGKPTSTSPLSTSAPSGGNSAAGSTAVTVVTSSSSDQKKSPTASACNSPKPYKSEKTDSDYEDNKSELNSGAPKVPPLKIVLAPGSLSEQETHSNNGKNSSNRQLPYVVNSNSGEEKEPSTNTESLEIAVSREEANVSSSSSSMESSSMSARSSTSPITVSSTTISSLAVSGATESLSTAATSIMSSVVCSGPSDKITGTRITRSHRGTGGSNSSDDQMPVKTEIKSDDSSVDAIHPRKRKIKMKQDPDPDTTSLLLTTEQPVANCYEMFIKIRRQIERRRKLLFPVQPKPPQGFKDYLMNRCSYVLANNATSQLSVPIIPPPASLSQPLKDLFSDQEQQRYKLRLQQLIEKEKLVLSVEQEILRVHGRAARALANQVLPFSVCTILKDEEVYNVISAEQEEKDRNARSRYNGRLFLSWLQDVDDKWEKIKEAMVLRHHNEAESLHAVQKMDWEWKLKELGFVEANSHATIDELHVPMVQVADFDLLPA